MIKYLFLLLALFPSFISDSAAADPLDSCREHVKYGIPSKVPILLCRKGYALSHDSKRKVPTWVSYHITHERTKAHLSRSEDFRSDLDLKPNERSELVDYKKSGYDRGHLAPAADMQWDEVAMSESFLLSNMAPQIGMGFNRGIWKNLEDKVRKWTAKRNELYVITGPIFSGYTPKTIGPDKVVVPDKFYKIIFDPLKREAIAFILPDKRLKSTDLPKFITSIDEVESETHLDFFSQLNDNIEAKLEAKKQDLIWK